MPLGDWLNPNSQTRRDRLRTDLEEVEARVQALENSSGGPLPRLYWQQGAPDPALGRDGDAALDLANGNLYLRAAGAWSLYGAFWLEVG